jgi:hypothetical protein
MIEVVAATAIVGVLLVAAMETLAAVQVSTYRAADYRAGRLLAGELLARIAVLKYADPQTPAAPLGPDSGETLATYDDVDDFAGYEDVPAGGGGSPPPAWRSSVQVVWVNAAALDGAAAATDTGLKRITVTTERRGVRVAQAVAIRSSVP